MGLVGRKVGMTQLFNDDGTVVPCTVIEAGPNTVLQVKKASGADGYSAIQLGLGTRRPQRTTKADAGHAKAANVAAPAVTREIRLSEADAAKFELGQVLQASTVFAVGQRIDIHGRSKGKGFQGVMKRHNFKGFERTHGEHEYHRHGGSIGTRLTPGMTLKGKRMPGHMGDAIVTVQNIEIVKIDADRNLVYLHGGVPGAPGAVVTIRKAVKNPK